MKRLLGIVIFSISLLICGACQAPSQAEVTADFFTKPWHEAWSVQKNIWGFTGETYIQELTFDKSEEGLLRLSLTAWGIKDHKWQVNTLNIEKDKDSCAFHQSVDLAPDLRNLVDADELFEQIEEILPECSYLSGDYGYSELVIEVEEGFLYGFGDKHEFYIVKEGQKSKLSEQLVIDTRHVLICTYPIGKIKAGMQEEKNKEFLITSLSGPLKTWKQEFSSEQKEHLVLCKLVDIDQDNKREEICLFSKESLREHSHEPQEYYLEIKKPEKNLLYHLELTDGYLGVNFLLRDVTGDHRPELICTEYVGGTGNINFLTVYEFKDDNLEIIFQAKEHTEIPGMKNTYLGKSRVSVAITPLFLTWEYDLLSWDYEGQDEQEIKELFAPDWLDPFSGYEFADLDHDGKVEIIGRQIICGIAHVDVIGTLKQTFSYNGELFVRKDIELYRFTPYGEEEKVALKSS